MNENKKRNTFGEDEELLDEFNWEQLKKLLRYVKQHKKKMILAFFVILISSFANLMTPLLMKFVIDDFIPERNVNGLILSSLAFILIILISSVCMKFRIRYMSQIGHQIIRDIRYDIFSHIQKITLYLFTIVDLMARS